MASAQVVAPLWPRLQTDLGLRSLTVTLLFSAWQLATSISQPIFGCWGDRFNSRWMIAFGPALAILCVSSIGLVHDPIPLTLLLLAGGLGIAAVSSEAAVGVVEASGAVLVRPGGVHLRRHVRSGIGADPERRIDRRRRTRQSDLVVAAGPAAAGGAGPVGAAHRALLAVFRLRPPASPYTLVRIGGRPCACSVVSTLRAIPALGVPLGLAFLLNQRGASETAIGEAQGVFLLSGGLGTLVCPLFVRTGRELRDPDRPESAGRRLSAVAGLGHPIAYPIGLAGSGLLLQGAVPILIAYSQRVLPGGQRLAASLTLERVGLAGMIVGALHWYFTRIGYLEGMLWAMVPLGGAAALAVWFCRAFLRGRRAYRSLKRR